MPTDFDETFDVATAMNNAETPEAIGNTLMGFVGRYGVSCLMAGKVPPPYYRGPILRSHLLISAYPSDWMARYNEQGYIHSDPIMQRLRGTAEAFHWSEEEMCQPNQLPETRRMFREAAEYGLKSGIAMSFRAPSGVLAAMSMGGEFVDVPPEDTGLMGMLSTFAMAKAADLLARGGNKRPELTQREIECLKWAADGKSEWEISVVLNVSEHTAAKHLANAQRKMGASNRSHAVALAIRWGFIS